VIEVTNELQERLENKLITKTFHVSGMPEALWKELDFFCKEAYGDARWLMIKDLYENAQKDYRFELLYDELQALKLEVEELKRASEMSGVKKGLPTFGSKEMK